MSPSEPYQADAPDWFFVTIRRDSKVGYLLGPFEAKAQADRWVEPVRKLANELHPMTHFDGFGVTKVPGTFGKPSDGSFNERMGL